MEVLQTVLGRLVDRASASASVAAGKREQVGSHIAAEVVGTAADGREMDMDRMD
jgi:hypothetical protein